MIAGPGEPLTGEILDNWRLTKPLPPQCALTPDVVAAICETVSAGNYVKTAVTAAGILPNTFDNWKVKAEKDPDSIYAEFMGLVEQAQARAEASNVQVIKTAAAKTWQAAAWLLERQYPEKWGRRDRVFNTVEGDIGHRVTFVFEESKAAKAQLEVSEPEEPMAMIGVNDAA